MNSASEAIRIAGRVLRVGRMDAETYHTLRDPEATIERLRRAKERIDLFTFVQVMPDTERKYSYSMEWDNQAVLAVTTFGDWWNKQIRPTTKSRVRQSERRGTETREVKFDEQFARGIWEIYSESPVRQGRQFRHYGKDAGQVYREAATYLEYSTFIGAYFGEELIGFVKLVVDEDGVQAAVMNILSKLQHRDKSPSNALIAHAVKWCAEKKISYLTYGNYSYGKKQRDGLSDFKEKNGFKRIELPRYWVPLTPLGRIALYTGLHRRLADRIPETVAERLRELRKNWYGRRMQAHPEAT